MSRDRHRIEIVDANELAPEGPATPGPEEPESAPDGATAESSTAAEPVLEPELVAEEADAPLEADGSVTHEVDDDGPPEESPEAAPESVEDLARSLEQLKILALEDAVKDLTRKLEATYSAHRERAVELERVRERLERDRERRLFNDKKQLLQALLAPLDDLERCLQAASLSGDIETMLHGLELVYKAFLNSFGAAGLQRFAQPGDPFDPKLHDALSIAPVDDPADHDRVYMVYLAGYRLDETVVRPARVIVGKYQKP